MQRLVRRGSAWASVGLAVMGFVLLGLAAGSGAEEGEANPRTIEGPGLTHDTTFPRPQRVSPNSPPDDGVGAQNVHGSDDRVQITTTTTYPFSAIAFLELYGPGLNLLGHCSGTLVGPRVVLTAAHCLYDPITGWISNVAVVPGKSGGTEPFGFQFATNMWVPDGWVLSGGNSLYDWGLVLLPNSTLTSLTGWMRIGVNSTATLQEADFQPAIVGYPGDKPLGTMWGQAAQAFASVTTFTLQYDIDTFGGQSGSAIFSINSGKFYFAYIVGIHTQGGPVYNSGMRIDISLANDLIEGCDQMGCLVDVWVETAATATPTSTPTPSPTPSPTPPGSSYQFTSTLFCRTDPQCGSGPEPLYVGEPIYAVLWLNQVPQQQLRGEGHWAGFGKYRDFQWEMPHTTLGYNTGSTLGVPVGPGTVEVRIWVGEVYVGAFSAPVMNAPGQPTPSATATLIPTSTPSPTAMPTTPPTSIPPGNNPYGVVVPGVGRQ